jgi:hypothetical protein
MYVSYVALKAFSLQRNTFLMKQEMQIECISLIKCVCCQKYVQKDINSRVSRFHLCLFYLFVM